LRAHHEQPTVFRFLRAADLCYVSSLHDGMNLVAKEFVAAQDSADPGVLLLSKFAGAAEHLTLALLTNPYHADGLAADLDTALRMPREERVTRQSALRGIVWRDTAAAWAERFLDALRG
jgi:trehalose 6-phosphate synthase